MRVRDPVWKIFGSGTHIPDHFSESLETVFLVKKYFYISLIILFKSRIRIKGAQA